MGTTTNYQIPYPEGSDPPAGHTQMQALAERVDLIMKALDTNVILGAVSGVDSIGTIPDGNSWSTVETPSNLVVPRPGILMVVGSCYLQHLVSSGDPQARVLIEGPVTEYISSSGRVGTGQTGGIEVWATTPVLAKAKVTGAGTITMTRQVRHHIPSGTGHQYANFDAYWVFVGEADT